MKKYLVYTTLFATAFMGFNYQLSAQEVEAAQTEQPKQKQKSRYSKVKCRGGCLKMNKKGNQTPFLRSRS